MSERLRTAQLTDAPHRATRDAYGHALLELMAENDDVIVLDADLSRSTRTEWIEAKYPERFYNLGIAEQNLFGVAAGLAHTGLVPFATTYAIFIGRGFDQIRQSIGFSHANVKVVATHAGLAASHDGGSHQGIEDLALMRVIPGLVVLSPADYNQAKQAVRAAAAHKGPVYIRLQKEPVPIITSADEIFQIGRASILRNGDDVALIATGSQVFEALRAAEMLAEMGIESCVVNVSTVKPLDVDTILSVGRACQKVIVIEEHSCIGGLSEAVASALSGVNRCPILSISIPDVFGTTGSWSELKDKFGLNAERITARICHALRELDASKEARALNINGY